MNYIKSMKVSSITIDNFYSDVDAVRQQALQQSFDVTGNYPGRRTTPFFNDSIQEVISSLIQPHAGKITWWGDHNSGTYQYTTKEDKSWIHADQTSHWAGVCYLTPNPPLNSGTGFFKHKETGLTEAIYTEEGVYDEKAMAEIYKDSQNLDKWEMTDKVENKYNRLIMYRGDTFHQSLNYFGDNMYNGRLFQTFFFNTEF